MFSAVDIVSGPVMPNTTWTIGRWDASICRHYDSVMGTDSCVCAAIVSVVAFKRRIVSIADFEKENISEFADCKQYWTNFFKNHILGRFI